MVIHQAKQNLIDFSIAVHPFYNSNWHHEIVANELEFLEEHRDKDYKILLIFQPPRHGKSQQVSIDFPAWFLGRNPDKEIITASYSGDLAQDFGSKTRALINSEQYQSIFNTRLSADEKAKAKWRTTEGGSYTSVGVGGPITGRGADFLCIDDPIKNREEAESDIYRDKVYDWFTSTAFTRLEPNGVIVIMHTRWHVDDLAGRILANNDLAQMTRVISFPAIAEFDEEYRKQGEPLWKQRFSNDALEDIKTTIGPYDWAALYQQTPILSENQEFKQAWFKQITESEVEKKDTLNFLTVDTAMSKRSGSDYTGLCDNSVDKENKWNLRAWRSRLDPYELIDMLFTLHDKRHYDKIGIEKTAYLEGLKPYLEEEQRKRNRFLPIVELHHNQAQKETRIRGLIPRYSSGSIFHITGQCADLEEELISFPLAAHDDVADAVAYQLQIARAVNTKRGYTRKPSWVKDYHHITQQDDEKPKSRKPAFTGYKRG